MRGGRFGGRRATWGFGLALVLGALPATGEPLGEAERTDRLEEVRATELAFAATVRDARPEAFAAMLDDDAVFAGAEGALRGRDVIAEAWAGFFAEGRPEFEWHPEVVELSGDGELGFTRGPWTLRATGDDGTTAERSGLFNSVWRRQPDGSWRIVFDAGCSPCPKCEEAPAAP